MPFSYDIFSESIYQILQSVNYQNALDCAPYKLNDGASAQAQ